MVYREAAADGAKEAIMSIFHNWEPRSWEWIFGRLGMPTASNFPRVMTPSKRGASSQSETYRNQLNGEWITGEPTEAYQSQFMEHGIEREDDAFAAYETLTEVETSPGGYWTTNDKQVGASPDRTVGGNGLLELKCPGIARQVETALKGSEIAKDHICQLQGQLYVCEREWVDLFSYHPALIVRPIRVYRDEEFIADLKRHLDDFITLLLRDRERLENEYGPFVRAGATAPPTIPERDAITDADVDAILAARRKQQE